MYSYMFSGEPYPGLNAAEASARVVTRKLELTAPKEHPDVGKVMRKCLSWYVRSLRTQ